MKRSLSLTCRRLVSGELGASPSADEEHTSANLIFLELFPALAWTAGAADTKQACSALRRDFSAAARAKGRSLLPLKKKDHFFPPYFCSNGIFFHRTSVLCGGPSRGVVLLAAHQRSCLGRKCSIAWSETCLWASAGGVCPDVRPWKSRRVGNGKGRAGGQKRPPAIKVPPAMLLPGGCRSRPDLCESKDHLQLLLVWTESYGMRYQNARSCHRTGHIWLSKMNRRPGKALRGRSPLLTTLVAVVSPGHPEPVPHGWLLVSATTVLALWELLFSFTGTTRLSSRYFLSSCSKGAAPGHGSPTLLQGAGGPWPGHPANGFSTLC